MLTWLANRPLVGLMAVNLAQKALDAARSYAGIRKQFGRYIGGFQLVQNDLAEIETAVLTYRLQADELGDLAPDTIRLLRQLGGGGTVEAVRLTSELSQRRTDLRVGTILVREWNGRPQRTPW